MVSNASGYARNRRNRRNNKRDFTTETIRKEKRSIIKSAQKSKRKSVNIKSGISSVKPRRF